MNKEGKIKLLNQIYQNCLIGIEALTLIKAKVFEKELETKINEQLERYLKIKETVENMLGKEDQPLPDDKEEIMRIIKKVNIDKIDFKQINEFADILLDASNKDIRMFNNSLNTEEENDDNLFNAFARNLLEYNVFFVPGLLTYYPLYFYSDGRINN